MELAAKIPLKCDICPKKLQFSNVNRLLTHVSSKAHLSNVFKARVRLEVDTESRRLIEDYDQWYAEWNIHDLLTERISQKENKATKPRRRSGARGATSGRRRASTATPSGTQSAATFPIHNGDPSVHMHHLPSFQANRLQQVPRLTLVHPSMQYGYHSPQYDGPYPQPNQVIGPLSSLASIHGPTAHLGPFGHPSCSGTPQTQTRHNSPTTGVKKRRAAALACDTRNKRLCLETCDTESPTPDSDTQEESEDENQYLKSTLVEPDLERDVVNGNVDPWPQMALRGPVYFGMGCFDGAEPQQRSHRNQKKSHESYMLLCRSSAFVAEAPFEVIYKIEEDGVWVFVKSRIITGYPSPSTIASPSPARSRWASLHKASHFIKEEETASNDDEGNELDIHQVVFGVRPLEKLSIYREGPEDVATRSSNTFGSKTKIGQRLAIRTALNESKENEGANSAGTAATIKTDPDGSHPGAHVTLPLTERRTYLHRKGPDDDGVAAPMGQGPDLSESPPLALTSPKGPLATPVTHSYFNGSWLQHASTMQPPEFLVDRSQGMHLSRAHHPSLRRPSPPFGLCSNRRQPIGFGRYLNGSPRTSRSQRLDNIAAVAPQDYNSQCAMSHKPNLMASTSNDRNTNMNQFSPKRASLGSELQTVDWLSAVPDHHSFEYHGRHSSQSWGMPAPLSTMTRGCSFSNSQAQDAAFMDTKPVQNSVGIHHADMAVGGVAPAQMLYEPLDFNPENWTPSQEFAGHSTYGLTGGPDSNNNQYLPSIAPALMTPYVFSAPAAPMVANQDSSFLPTTQTRGLMPPPPSPKSAERLQKSVSGASSRSMRTKGPPRGSASRGRTRNNFRGRADCIPPVPRLAQPEDVPSPTLPKVLPEPTTDTTIDEDHTVTAPGTPSDAV